MANRKSVVRRMFSENPVDIKCATCALCNDNVARGGKNVGSFSTSNLWQHLQRSHKDTYNLLKEEEKNGTTTGGVAKTTLQRQQSTITATFDSRRPFDRDDPRAKHITKLIAEMMALDDLPFHFVNNKGFRRMISHLEPGYHLPDDKYFRTRMLPDVYSGVRTEVRKQVEQAECVSFTTDTWSTAQCTDSLISLTAHWIGDDWKQKSALLHAQQIEGR